MDGLDLVWTNIYFFCEDRLLWLSSIDYFLWAMLSFFLMKQNLDLNSNTNDPMVCNRFFDESGDASRRNLSLQLLGQYKNLFCFSKIGFDGDKIIVVNSLDKLIYDVCTATMHKFKKFFVFNIMVHKSSPSCPYRPFNFLVKSYQNTTKITI